MKRAPEDHRRPLRVGGASDAWSAFLAEGPFDVRPLVLVGDGPFQGGDDRVEVHLGGDALRHLAGFEQLVQLAPDGLVITLVILGDLPHAGQGTAHPRLLVHQDDACAAVPADEVDDDGRSGNDGKDDFHQGSLFAVNFF